MVANMAANGELDISEAAKNQSTGRLGQQQEIASSVLWLGSFVVGVALPGDGGYTAQ